MRVARLDTGKAWAEDPPSRTRHLIGNLEAAPLENGEVRAKTAFLVFRSHLETDHQLLSGCREDVLRQMNGAWKASRRTIVLDADVLFDKNLSVPLRVKTNRLDASQPLSRRSRKSITTAGYAPKQALRAGNEYPPGRDGNPEIRGWLRRKQRRCGPAACVLRDLSLPQSLEWAKLPAITRKWGISARAFVQSRRGPADE